MYTLPLCLVAIKRARKDDVLESLVNRAVKVGPSKAGGCGRSKGSPASLSWVRL